MQAYKHLQLCKQSESLLNLSYSKRIGLIYGLSTFSCLFHANFVILMNNRMVDMGLHCKRVKKGTNRFIFMRAKKVDLGWHHTRVKNIDGGLTFFDSKNGRYMTVLNMDLFYMEVKKVDKYLFS